MGRIMSTRNTNEGVNHAAVQDIQEPAHAQNYEDQDHNEGVKNIQEPVHAQKYEYKGSQ